MQLINEKEETENMNDELSKKLYHLKLTIKTGILFGFMGVFILPLIVMTSSSIDHKSPVIVWFTSFGGALLFWGLNTWIYFKKFEKEFNKNHDPSA